MFILSTIITVSGLGATIGGAIATIAGTSVATGTAIGTIAGAGAGLVIGAVKLGDSVANGIDAFALF